MTITIKIIYDSDFESNHTYKMILNWELKKLNSNYSYKIIWISLNEIDDYHLIRSSIIIFDNINLSKKLLNLIRKLKHSSPLVNLIYLYKNLQINDELKLLNVGIDHFVNNLSSGEELLKAIIKNILAKSSYIDLYNSVFLHTDNYCLDLIDKKVWKNETLIPVTRREFELFKYYVLNKDKVLSKNEILESVWGYIGISDTTNLVSQHTFRIRRKLNILNLVYIKKEGYIYLSNLPNLA